MSVQTTVRLVTAQGLARQPPAPQIERLDRLLAEAERRLAEQEAYVREISQVNGNTAIATFELQRMHLLIALLREGRGRLSAGN
jgi:hypothetical protein